MPIEPEFVLKAIDERHVKWLSHEQTVVLATLCLAYPVSEAAELLAVSESTFARRRRELIHLVFDLTELKGTPERLRLWCERHFACCTAGVQEMTETGQILIGSS